MRIFRNRSGATAIEYCLIAAMFALVVLTAFYYLSDEITELYTMLKDAVVDANNGEE